nr:phosphotransferase [Bacteroidales bacterium]
MEQLRILFEQFTGEQLLSTEELPSSGSNRRYFRLKGKNYSLIGAQGTCVDENIAFITIARHFRKQGLNVPQVYNCSEDNIYYLQEDLGDDTLFSRIAQGRESGKYSHKEKELLLKTIRKLPSIQFEGARGLDFSVCYPQPEFDERMI